MAFVVVAGNVQNKLHYLSLARNDEQSRLTFVYRIQNCHQDRTHVVTFNL